MSTHDSANDSLKSLLEDYSDSGVVAFHMPGHQRNSRFEHLLGLERLDITEIEGFDNLHDASGILLDAERRMARVFGAKHSRILLNGSTVGVLAAVRALTRKGDGILIATNCHKSVYHAAEMNMLASHYVLPEYLAEDGFYGSVTPESIERCLIRASKYQNGEGIKLVVITSPTYEGVISDIKSIADVCHAYGAALFVDEAHGSHLGLRVCGEGNVNGKINTGDKTNVSCESNMSASGIGGVAHEHFPESARSQGADIVVNSLHKTLPSLTQTSVLHVLSDRVNVSRLDESIAMLQSSSPSYPLMASVDGCVRFLEECGEQELMAWSDSLDCFHSAAKELKNINLFDGRCKDSRSEALFDFDKSKLIISAAHMSGVQLIKALRERKIELEMAGEKYALAMTGMGNTAENYAALMLALKELDPQLEDAKIETASDAVGVSNLPLKTPQKAVETYEIDRLSVEYVNIQDAIGRISAEYVWAYPPGAPLIIKGCAVDKCVLDEALRLSCIGVSVSSSLKSFPNGLYVIKRDSL